GATGAGDGLGARDRKGDDRGGIGRGRGGDFVLVIPVDVEHEDAGFEGGAAAAREQDVPIAAVEGGGHVVEMPGGVRVVDPAIEGWISRPVQDVDRELAAAEVLRDGQAWIYAR